MKVAYILSSTDDFAGSTRSFLTLLPGLMAQGVQPVVIVPEEGGVCGKLREMGAKVHVLTYRCSVYPRWRTLRDVLLFLPRLAYQLLVNTFVIEPLARLLREEHVVLVHSNVSILRVGHLAARRLGIPHIFHIREYADRDFALHYIPTAARYRTQFVAPGNYSICITRDIQQYHGLDEAQGSLAVYDGICRRSQKLGEEPRNNYFLFAGHVEPAKDVLQMVRAYIRYAQQSVVPIPLWIAGGSDNLAYVAEVKATVERAGMSNLIQFMGERSDIQELMQRARCIIIPSHSEGFGRCMAEAMFNGCLVVGYDAAGTHEQFENGLRLAQDEIGIRYRTEDELVQALQRVAVADHAAYQPMRERAYQVVNELYTIERNVADVYAMYCEITKNATSEKP